MLRKIALFLLCLFMIFLRQVHAAPISSSDVPDALKPWINWVLHGSQRNCPYLNGNADERICAWSSVLSLSLSEKSGSFQQQWRLYEDTWVSLPGNNEQWPQEV